MKKTLLIFFLCFIYSNNPPIFLIHGFMGWGRNELNNYYYWGGKNDLEAFLREKGYNVYTLSVGPISSNWERAIEAYTQIKGGCVDYGKNHSETFNIIQKPIDKCYEGLYKQWDKDHPIHIIGHSQGGLTARMLEYLLLQSIKEENSELLSVSHDNTIKSITTISTPHNGTTLALIMNNKFPVFQRFSGYVGMMNYILFQKFYNFDLEQWGLTKKDNENYYQFLKRISNSNINNTKNSAAWDLSLEGCKEFNKVSKINPNTYYFSFSTSASVPKYNSVEHKPNKSMSYYIKPTSRLMGAAKDVDSLWYENDGIVNTISMKGPSTQKIIEYDKTNIMSGLWMHMGIKYYDHHQILLRRLRSQNKNDLFNLYLEHCKLLYTL